MAETKLHDSSSDYSEVAEEFSRKELLQTADKRLNAAGYSRFEHRQAYAIHKKAALRLAFVALTSLSLGPTTLLAQGGATTEVGTPRAQTLIIDALDGRVNNPTQMNPYLQSTLFNEVSINWRFRLCGKWTPSRASSSRRWPQRCLNRSTAISPP